jgi:hypothetical protein
LNKIFKILIKDEIQNTGDIEKDKDKYKDKEIKLFFRGKPLKDNDTLEQHSNIKYFIINFF